MNQESPLSLEEFIGLCNNFHLHFVRGASNEWRHQPHFRRFQKEHPLTELRLTNNFTPEWLQEKRCELTEKLGGDKVKEPFYERFYEAYKIMRDYVDSDVDISIARFD